MKTSIKYLEIGAEDRINILQKIAEIDNDYASGEEVGLAISAGMNPDEWYVFEESEESDFFVSKK